MRARAFDLGLWKDMSQVSKDEKQKISNQPLITDVSDVITDVVWTNANIKAMSSERWTTELSRQLPNDSIENGREGGPKNFLNPRYHYCFNTFLQPKWENVLAKQDTAKTEESLLTL